jgi:hypothetical protein
MLRVDCFKFYSLGRLVHPLTLLKDEEFLKDIWFDVYQVKGELKEFFAAFPLRISLDPANKLYEVLGRIVPDEFQAMDLGNEESGWKTVGVWGWSIRQAANSLETVLAAELNNFDTYFVSQKGSFSTPDLIEQAEKMLPERIRSHLSTNAIEDFRQAGRCLAFSLGTAAAFHIARSTEDVIRAYYTLVVGTIPGVKMRSWGTYHKNLSKCGNASKKVLGWLDHIKDEYRNPVLHPDETVSPDAALVFINACSALIILMVNEMIRLKQEEAQLNLALPEVPSDPAYAALSHAFTSAMLDPSSSVRSGDEEDTLDIEGGTTEAVGSGEEG